MRELIPRDAKLSVNIDDFIASSNRLLVITGAGCSTGSGIGDYRDDNGDWKRVQPVQQQDFMASHGWRQRYWARSQVGYPEFMRAQPNRAHHMLARMERSGRMSGLVTQNVDRLHQRAGHRNVIDLHGRLDQVVCTECGALSTRNEVQVWLDAHNSAGAVQFTLAPDGDADVQSEDFSDFRVPDCLACGGVLKPHVVFFGDSVPKPLVDRAYAWVEAADAILVVGSSLMVFSSFRFVRRAREAGIPIAAINRGRTRADDWLTVKVEDDCGAVLERIVGTV